MTQSALDGVRILDLTSEMGWYCGKLLADLGADVIKVEPVGGDPSRGRAPFWQGVPGRETSLRFWYFNANKRSVTLDLGQYDGRWLFGELVKTADIMIESWTAAERSDLAEHGVDPDGYMEAQPALIWVSITGFGLDGPRAGWEVTDIVAQAAAGIATLAGYPDGSPMRIAGNQAYAVAGISAAQGALLALLHAEATGSGQRVETSIQEALSICQETAHLQWDFQGTSRERVGESFRLPGIRHLRDQRRVHLLDGRRSRFRRPLDRCHPLDGRERHGRGSNRAGVQQHPSPTSTCASCSTKRNRPNMRRFSPAPRKC